MLTAKLRVQTSISQTVEITGFQLTLYLSQNFKQNTIATHFWLVEWQRERERERTTDSYYFTHRLSFIHWSCWDCRVTFEQTAYEHWYSLIENETVRIPYILVWIETSPAWKLSDAANIDSLSFSMQMQLKVVWEKAAKKTPARKLCNDVNFEQISVTVLIMTFIQSRFSSPT